VARVPGERRQIQGYLYTRITADIISSVVEKLLQKGCSKKRHHTEKIDKKTLIFYQPHCFNK